MKRLTESEKERLQLLQEECAEVIQCASKILRFGWLSTNPDNPNSKNNLEHLQEEIGNLGVILDLMVKAGDVSEEDILEAAEEKSKTIGQYLRFQE